MSLGIPHRPSDLSTPDFLEVPGGQNQPTGESAGKRIQENVWILEKVHLQAVQENLSVLLHLVLPERQKHTEEQTGEVIQVS